MTDRTVSIKLRAEAQQYKREMDESRSKTADLSKSMLLADKQSEGLADGLRRTGERARGAGRDVDGFSGDVKDAGQQLGHLDRQIAETAAELRLLARQFNETGDASNLKGFDGASAKLSQLTRVRKQLLDDLGDGGDVEPAGLRFGQRFGAGVSNGLLKIVPDALGNLPPQAQVAIGVGIAAAVTAAGPLIGGAAAAAVIGAGGGLGLVGGIMLAARDPAIALAFKSLGDDILGSMGHDAAEAFGKPLAGAADVFRDTFDGIRPDVQAIFADMAANGLGPMVAGVSRFTRELTAGLREVAAASGPTFAALGQVVGDIGADLHSVFGLMADDAQGAGLAIMVLGDALRVLGPAVGVMWALGKGLEVVADTASALPDWTKWIAGAPLNYLASQNDELKEMTGNAPQLSGELGHLADAENWVSIFAQQASSSIGGLSTNMMAASGSALSLDQATLQYKDSVRALKDSLDQNGNSLDQNTARGSANVAKIHQGVAAARAQYDATVAASAATDVSGEKARAAAVKYNEQVQKLLDVARAAGASASELARMQGDYKINILTTRKTVFVEQGAPQSGPRLGVNIAQRRGGVVNAAGGLASRAGIYADGVDAVHFAERGTGGELFLPLRGISRDRAANLLAVGASKYGLAVARPADYGRPAAMTSATGGGSSVTFAPQITVHAGVGTDGNRVGQQIVDALRPVINRSGGNVQAVLGRPGA